MKPFNIRFQEYKDSLSKLTSLGEEAFMYWFKNYVNQKDIKDNPDHFLTGKIYSFEYMDKLEKNKKFINKRPIVFVMEYFNNDNRASFGGIDIILISPMKRISLLNRIQGVYQNQIDENEKRSKAGGVLDQIQLKTDYETFGTIMTGIPWKNPYRAWDIKKIRDIKEITYEDWTKIVYLHTRSTEGIGIEEIYNKNSKI